MNNAQAIPFHAGPELSRAINRTDFFRLLKSAAQHYNFDNFALARISEASAPFGERDIVITNVAERRVGLFITTLKEALAPSGRRPPSSWQRRSMAETYSRQIIRPILFSTSS